MTHIYDVTGSFLNNDGIRNRFTTNISAQCLYRKDEIFSDDW